MPVLLDRFVYCIGTFTHISVRVFLLMYVQKLGVLETAGVLLNRVPIYEEKNNIYGHSIFCNKLVLQQK